MSPAQSSRFFESVFSSIIFSDAEKVVLISHIVPGVEDFIFALNDLLPVAAVIPKPSSIDVAVMSKVANRVPIMNVTREEISRSYSQFLAN